MQGKSYYDMLGVSRKASVQQIRDAYREVARVYHPDSNFYDEIVNERPTPEDVDTFKLLTNAYHTLIHAAKRREYDESLPPELADWEEGQDAQTVHQSWKNKKTDNSDVYAMGTFGRVKPAPTSTFSSSETSLKSVAQMIPRGSFRRGLFHRVRMFFGLW